MFATGSERGTQIAKKYVRTLLQSQQMWKKSGDKINEELWVLIHQDRDLCSFLGRAAARNRMQLMTKSPWLEAKGFLGGQGNALETSALYTNWLTPVKKHSQYFFLTHLENQDGSSIFNRLFAVLMGACSRQGRARPSVHGVIPKVTQTCEGSIHLSIQKHGTHRILGA